MKHIEWYIGYGRESMLLTSDTQRLNAKTEEKNQIQHFYDENAVHISSFRVQVKLFVATKHEWCAVDIDFLCLRRTLFRSSVI